MHDWNPSEFTAASQTHKLLGNQLQFIGTTSEYLTLLSPTQCQLFRRTLNVICVFSNDLKQIQYYFWAGPYVPSCLWRSFYMVYWRSDMVRPRENRWKIERSTLGAFLWHFSLFQWSWKNTSHQISSRMVSSWSLGSSAIPGCATGHSWPNVPCVAKGNVKRVTIWLITGKIAFWATFGGLRLPSNEQSTSTHTQT